MSNTRRVIFVSMLFLQFGAATALTINGNVKDANTRAAVDSAVVSFANFSGTIVAAITDTKGDYHIVNIPNQPASGVLSISKTGYRPFQASVENAATISTIDIALIPAGAGTARLTGTVTDQPTGNAVAGVQVALFVDEGKTVPTPYDTATTVANGTYTFDSLFANNNIQYDVIVSKTGFFPSANAAITLTSGQTRALNIALAPIGNKMGTIKGKITGAADQAAIADAKVALTQNTNGNWEIVVDSTTTNQIGDFTFDSIPVANGYKLSVFAPGFASQYFGTFRVDSGVTITRNLILGVMVPPSSIIKGTVTDSASSNAVAGTQVILRMRSSSIWQSIDTAMTLANGTYSFNGLDVGEYSLIVGKTDYRTSTSNSIMITVNPDTITVNMALTTIAKGVMCVFVGDNGGNAVSGASVSAIEKLTGGQTGQTYSATTAATGWVTLANIAVGTYDVTVAKTGYNTTSQSNRTILPKGIDTTTFVLVQATGACKVVKGAAKTSAGTGIAGMVVTLTAQRPGGSILTLVRASTTDGSYEITGIPAGITAADLLFSKSGCPTKDTNGIALTADTTTVNVKMQIFSTSLRGGVANRAAHAAVKTSIRVYGLDGRLMAIFAETDFATVHNSLSKTVRTHQSVILKWIENGRTMQKKTVIR
jgi:large repetitive protein